MRGIAYNRHNKRRVINRKKDIIHSQHDYWNYKYEGTLSKGKIHCSCWLCSGKTAVHGYKISDLRKFDSIEEQLDDYNSQG